VTAPDPRLGEIEARLAADVAAYNDHGFIGDNQCMTDRDYLLTELRKRDDALMAGLALADKWAALCPEDDWPENGDMSAAPLADAGRAFRAAVTAGKGDGEL